jgi:hypothetical protein
VTESLPSKREALSSNHRSVNRPPPLPSNVCLNPKKTPKHMCWGEENKSLSKEYFSPNVLKANCKLKRKINFTNSKRKKKLMTLLF